MTIHIHECMHMYLGAHVCTWTKIDESCLSQVLWTPYFKTGYLTEPGAYIGQPASPRGPPDYNFPKIIERL